MQQSHPQVPRVVLALGALLSIRFTSVGELQTHFEMYQVQSQGEVGNCSKEVQNASRRDRRIWIGKQMHRLNSASCLKCLLKAMDRFIFPPWSTGFLEWISSVCLLASTQSSFLKSVCKKTSPLQNAGTKADQSPNKQEHSQALCSHECRESWHRGALVGVTLPKPPSER